MRWLRASGLVIAGVFQPGLVVASEPAAAQPVGKLDGQRIDAGAAVDVPAGAVKRLLLDNGARVTLKSGTSAIASPQQWYPPEKGGKSIRGSRVFLKEGEVTVRLPPDAAKPTAVSVATVGGAAVLLWHGAARIAASDGAMTVIVDEGAAYVGSQDQWLRLHAGTAAVLPKKQPPKLYKGRPAPPEHVPCSEGGVGLGFGLEKVPVRVCWSAVAGATGYRVELAVDPAMEQVVEALDAPGSATMIEPRVAPGAYWARVRAIGAEAVPGLDSRPRRIHALGATLPPGAVIAKDGVILVSREGAITLDPSGALVTSAGGYDVPSALASAMAGTPSPSTAKAYGLGGQRARVVRFRDELGAEARLVLQLRDIRARVEMTPARARWPETPIDAVVVLEDTSKRVDLAAEPVTLEVAVDSRPVPVTWTRTGDTFRTRIMPVDGPGPFLVRVVVRDQGGSEIGGRVLDIDGRRPLREMEKKLKERIEAEERRR